MFWAFHANVGYFVAEVAIKGGASVTLCEGMDDGFGYVRECCFWKVDVEAFDERKQCREQGKKF